MATANQELQKRLENEPAGTYDIEQIDSDKPHIEMVRQQPWKKKNSRLSDVITKISGLRFLTKWCII